MGWQNEWGVLQMFLGEKRTSSRLHMLHRRREGSGIEGGVIYGLGEFVGWENYWGVSHMLQGWREGSRTNR